LIGDLVHIAFFRVSAISKKYLDIGLILDFAKIII
jgi:hypothetical protein